MRTERLAMTTRALAGATVAALLMLGSWAAAPARGDDHAGRRPRPLEIEARQPRPLVFEDNRGQADAQVRFVARAAGYTVSLTSTEAVLALPDGRRGRTVVRLKPIGASAAAEILPEDELPGIARYSRRGAAAMPVIAPTYARVRYVDVYPGVDLVYYGRSDGLEYDFVLAPGADPGQIGLGFEGADRVELAGDGALVVHTAAGELRQPRPFAYQVIDGVTQPVTADYLVDPDGYVRLRVGAYDASRPLVIDPALAYSAYLGGSDEESDWSYGAAFGIAVDAAGNAYVTGTTRSADFPTTAGGDQALGGEQDVFGRPVRRPRAAASRWTAPATPASRAGRTAGSAPWP